MIYITYVNSSYDDNLVISNVYTVGIDNVKDKYIEFMYNKANELNIVINPHWLNIMNYADHNNHLSVCEYVNKSKKWNKTLKKWNIDKFILDVLSGTKEKYTTIVRF